MKKVIAIALVLLAVLTATVLIAGGAEKDFPESASAVHVQPTYGG